MLLWLLSFVLSKTVTRYRFLPDEISSLTARLTLFVLGISASFAAFQAAAAELHDAGSGVAFTPVAGITTTGPYAYSRNPLYVLFVFVKMPLLALLFDSAWLVFSAGAMFVYLSTVVIPIEEAFLAANFGTEYAAYCNSTPRWLFAE